MRTINTTLFFFCIVIFANLAHSAPKRPPAKVVVQEVFTRAAKPTQKLTGIIDFDRISAVSGEVSGLITILHITEGSHVKTRDPLVELNADLIKKDKDIKSKQIAQVTSDINKVRQSLKRLESLLKNNSASRQAYDDTRFDLRSLQKKRETLEQEMERLHLQQNMSVIRAPFDGIILEKLKEKGEWLTPGSAIARIASTNDLLVTIALPENLISYQNIGASVAVTIPATSRKLEGVIRSLGPVANRRSRSVELKIEIPYSAGLMQNLTAEVNVSSGVEQELQWIPRDALIRKGKSSLVYTIVDGKSKAIPVEVISSTSSDLGVKNPNIKKGMPIVINGNDRLRPNQPVQIIKP